MCTVLCTTQAGLMLSPLLSPTGHGYAAGTLRVRGRAGAPARSTTEPMYATRLYRGEPKSLPWPRP